MPIRVQHDPSAGSVAGAAALSGATNQRNIEIARRQQMEEAAAHRAFQAEQAGLGREFSASQADASRTTQARQAAGQQASQLQQIASRAREQSDAQAIASAREKQRSVELDAEQAADRSFKMQMEAQRAIESPFDVSMKAVAFRNAEATAKLAETKAQQAEARNTVWKYTARDSQRRTRLMAAMSELPNNPAFSPEQVEIALPKMQAEYDAIKKQPFPRGRDDPFFENGPPGTVFWHGGAQYTVQPDGTSKLTVRPEQDPAYLAEKLAAEQAKESSKQAFNRREFQHELRVATKKVGIGMEAREEPRYTEPEVKRMVESLYPSEDQDGVARPDVDAVGLFLEPQEVQKARTVLELDPTRPFKPGGDDMSQKRAKDILQQWEKGVADVDKKLPVVNSQSDHDKLKSGQRFRTATGEIGTKM